jgi:uncharacterized protein YcfJ
MQRNTGNKQIMTGNILISKSTLSLFVMAFFLSQHTFAQPTTGKVLTITQETFTEKTKPQVCWEKIITGEQKAAREEQNTPWLKRYWQPLLGAAMGAPIAYTFTANYGVNSQKWVWPTVAGGAVAGAVAGPGFTAGAYGLGVLAYSIWPASLPLTIGFSLAGGILGDKLWKMIFPSNKPEKVNPGQYMANQEFFIETTCTLETKITYSQSGYLIKYLYKGKPELARVKYYPGQQVALTTAGRPVDELQVETTATQK